MSKYIIDIPDNVKKIVYFHVGNANAVWTTSNDLDDLELLNSDYINEHFGDLQDTAYQRGFEDGKAVNDRGCESCKYAKVAGTHEPCVRCSNSYGNQWTAKDDKIEVGDEVRLCRHKVPYIVTSCDGDDDAYILMTVNGGFIKAEKYNVRKTSRHFDIDKILEEMRHD